jgi:NADH:ubiquinone oxidoreductase subunit D
MMPERIDFYEQMLTGNPIWNVRTRGVGYMTLEDMLDWASTGPMMRGRRRRDRRAQGGAVFELREI